MFKFVRVGSDPLPKFLLPKFTQSYALTDLIGKGTFGKVYEGCRREFAGYSFERVAVKIVDLTPGKSVDVLETERQAQSERLLLSGFRHVSVSVTVSRQFSLLIVFLFQANIVSIIDSFRCLSTACIVLEFLAGGDLLLRYRSPVLYELDKEGTVKVIFLQIVLAVAYIHSQGFVHRDLKVRSNYQPPMIKCFIELFVLFLSVGERVVCVSKC